MRSASALLLIVAGAAAGAASQTDPLRGTFLDRVDAYVALHRQVEAPLPREVITVDPQELFASRTALAAALRRARANARQGEIFSPEVARYFRAIIADALRSGAVDDMLGIVRHENTVTAPSRVNAEFPGGRSIAMMPPCLLAALPPLPPELQYRFVRRDLILWDVHAGLIVDFVPDALEAVEEH